MSESEQNTTRARLFDLLDRFDDRLIGLHFGGHGDPEGLLFEDDVGRSVAGFSAGIAERLRDLPRLRWIFLNGCGTAAHVSALHGPVAVPVIATEIAIRDDVAVDVARRFYHGLSHGQTIRQAYTNVHSALRTAWSSPGHVLRPSDDASMRMLRPAGGSGRGRWPWVLAVPEKYPETAERGLLDTRTTLDIAAIAGESVETADAWPPPQGEVTPHHTADPALASGSRQPAVDRLPVQEDAVILRNARVLASPSSDAFSTDERPTLKQTAPADSTTQPFRRRETRPTKRRPRPTGRGRIDRPARSDAAKHARPQSRRVAYAVGFVFLAVVAWAIEQALGGS